MLMVSARGDREPSPQLAASQSASFQINGEEKTADVIKGAKPFLDKIKEGGLKGVKEDFKQIRTYLPPGERKAWQANPKKNRYQDIQCLDATRVKLKNCDSDYIHANYVTCGKLTFICTQGPLEPTVSQFWTMILQEKCKVIVMLCKFVEFGTEKCFQYIPQQKNKPLTFGTIKVTKLESTVIPGTKTVTKTRIELESGTHKETLTHYHYDGWCDHCCPDDTKACVKFALDLFADSHVKNAPAVVHCSAGVGRTGAFVGIALAIQKIAAAPFSMSDTLKALRNQRMHAIQNDLQYLFVTRALLDILIKKHVVDGNEAWVKTFCAEYDDYTMKKRKSIQRRLINKKNNSQSSTKGTTAEDS